MKKRVFNFIKKLIINTFATTTMSIVLTSVSSLIAGGLYMGFTVPLEILLANFLAHIGFILINKIDMKYQILNYLVILVDFCSVAFCFVSPATFTIPTVISVAILYLAIALFLLWKYYFRKPKNEMSIKQ